MAKKIDWKNHIVSFFSALLGILIAFQLEDYQDDRQENEKLKITLEAIKNEIDHDRNVYQNNVNNLSNFLEYFDLRNLTNDKGVLTVNKDLYEKLKAKSPDRFSNWTLLEQLNDSTLTFDTKKFFFIDVVPETGVSTNSWQAGLYQGVLNRLDNETLSQLTQVYEWISKDIGLNERELYENVLLSEITAVDPVITQYKKIVAVQQFKLKMINQHYSKIDWQ